MSNRKDDACNWAVNHIERAESDIERLEKVIGVQNETVVALRSDIVQLARAIEQVAARQSPDLSLVLSAIST